MQDSCKDKRPDLESCKINVVCKSIARSCNLSVICMNLARYYKITVGVRLGLVSDRSDFDHSLPDQINFSHC